MKIKVLALTIFLVISTSCSNDDNSDLPIIASCGVQNPIEDLEWLKKQVDEIKSDKYTTSIFSYIEIAEYKNETIFIANNCCPICNSVIPVYNCEGEFLGLIHTDIEIQEISNRRIIYKRNDSECSKD